MTNQPTNCVCDTLTSAFNDKCRDYLAACQREGIAFIPLPVETLGGWHPKAVLQIKKLARAQARTTGKDEVEAIRQLFQRWQSCWSRVMPHS